MVTNNDVRMYFESLELIGTFGVYQNTKGNGYSIRVSDEDYDAFEDVNEVFKGESSYGNKFVMVMMPEANDEEILRKEIPKLRVGFKVSGLTIDEAIVQAQGLREADDDFLTMMAGGQTGTGVTVKAPEEEFVIDE